MEQRTEWEPQILGFLCKWCSYAGADLAGTSRKKYPANMRIMKIPCSGRIDPLFITKALLMGFDGVLVSGCHPGDCQYLTGNYRARRRMALTKRFLEDVGVEPQRVQAGSGDDLQAIGALYAAFKRRGQPIFGQHHISL